MSKENVMKYSKPGLKNLKGYEKAMGVCGPGSGVLSNCTTGTLDDCTHGSNANGDCAPGTSANDFCSPQGSGPGL